MIDVTSKLSSFGLSDKESRVYLTLLELGTSAVAEIAKSSEINRSTAYVVLEGLIMQGLVSTADQGGSRVYTPASPERIVSNLEKKHEFFGNLAQEAKVLLPELQKIHKYSGTRTNIQYFEGIEGIRSAYEDTLTSKTVVRSFAPVNDSNDYPIEDFLTYKNKRSQNGIQSKTLMQSNIRSKNAKTAVVLTDPSTSLVTVKNVNFDAEINTYDDKTVIISPKDKQALIISSKDISNMLSTLFDLAWTKSKNSQM